MKLKLNDIVLVTAGKDKGRQGKILRIFSEQYQVLVEGVNAFVKHQKARQGKNAERVTKFRPLNVAKVALVCPKCHQPTRVGYQVDQETKEKKRICRKCHKTIN